MGAGLAAEPTPQGADYPCNRRRLRDKPLAISEPILSVIYDTNASPP
jgi:hypothetical protein